MRISDWSSDVCSSDLAIRGSSMKPAPFNLHLPTTVEEALQLLSGMPNARAIAGGQSLMPMLNMRLAMPDDIIDLNRIESLSYIRAEGDEIAIGAMTRQDRKSTRLNSSH